MENYSHKYLNLTPNEVRGVQNGTCTQIIRRARTADAYTREQVYPETDVFGPAGTTLGLREPWRVLRVYPDNAQVTIEYRAGGMRVFNGVEDFGKYSRMAGDTKWHPANHQPKFSIRNWVQVQGLHVHRLLDLREEDARYIGIEPINPEHHEYIHPGHTNPELWGYPWQDYELKTFDGETTARDSYFSWYRYNHGKTNFQSNEWQIRATIKITEAPTFY